MQELIRMKYIRPFLVLLFLAGCSSAAHPTKTAATPTSSLPTPVVMVTHAPDPKEAVKQFMEAWKSEDYATMYSLVTPLTHDSITQDDFAQKYKDTANSLTLQKLDYEILTALTNPSVAQVSVRVTYHTALLGDLSRDFSIGLGLEKGVWQVQWEDGLILPELHGGNSLSLDVQIPARGNIYDRNGHGIAAQADAYSLGVIPAAVGPDAENSLLMALSNLTGIPGLWIRSMYYGNETYYVGVGETSKDVYDQFGGALADFTGVEVTPYNTRYYYDGGISPQAIGHVQMIPKETLDEYKRKGYLGDEKVGVSGLEQWGEQYLAGTHGGSLYVIDQNKQIVTRMAQVEPKTSQSVYTTIDKDLQEGVQKSIAGFDGAVVVLERDTGRVLAMASSPGYDPNLFDPYNANYQFLTNVLNNQEQPLLNRATQGQYPLGSVFKIVTMAAALESKQFTAESSYNCTSDFTEVQGVTLYDWTHDHGIAPSGVLTLPEGLMRSCDPWFWHIGLDLYDKGLTKTVSDMARSFGLGSATGIEGVDEATGSIPDPQEEIDAVNEAIGQGAVLVTPLQVADFMAAVGNGGTLYKPQIIEKITPPDGDPSFVFKPEVRGTLPVSAENLKTIQDAMRSVVENSRGTAYPTFSGLGVPVYGKTGTAQTSDGVKPHAWFAGYTDAKNANKPDIAIAVLLSNQGEGADWAAPVFRRVVELYFNGQPGRPYRWESMYYITRTPTVPGTPTTEGQGTPNP
jgi:penicillin-binding protein 2